MPEYEPGTIWPADDKDSKQIREVYSRYGLAMYMAQVLEHGIVNAIIIARLLPTMRQYTDPTAWEKAFDQAYDSELMKTFGTMLRALEPLELDDEIMQRLRSAKVERDRLAHRFFREHDESFFSMDGRTRMIIECEYAIEQFSDADRALEATVGPLRERYGITTEWVEAQVKNAIAAAEAKA